jgi:hypothetical protein
MLSDDLPFFNVDFAILGRYPCPFYEGVNEYVG